jgi:hypothetical protein
MKTFNDLEFKEHTGYKQGKSATMFFPNGYGVSVVRFRLSNGKSYSSYTSDETEWELAVLKGTPESATIAYDTPITDDVIGHITDNEVTEIMEKVQKL